MDQDAIIVEGLEKSYGSVKALCGVDFSARTGTVLGLLGPNGAGKSTLLGMLATLVAPTSGSVRYRGAELNGANPGAAMVFQTFALMPWLTVQDNVELGLAARGVPPAERHGRALRAIDLIGLLRALPTGIPRIWSAMSRPFWADRRTPRSVAVVSIACLTSSCRPGRPASTARRPSCPTSGP